MEKKRVLVLGATGMAGHMIITYLEEQGSFDVDHLSHKKKLNDKTHLLDATDFNNLGELLDREGFDVIINAIGILNHFADMYKHKAVLLNSYLPHYLEEKFRGKATKVIHLSTDCVFSGKTGRYTEASFRDGDTFYDRTKAIGEIFEDNSLTFRTSIIGPDMNYDGIGLFNWFIKSKGIVRGYLNAIWTGVTTLELAKAIEKAILVDLRGLYHLVPEESISKHQLLLLFKAAMRLDSVEVEPYNNEPLDKSLVNTRKDFDYKVPNYKTMVEEMREWIEGHLSLYPHYTRG